MNVGVKEKPVELSYDGYVPTAMRIVNAIPMACAGKGGVLIVQDLSLYLPGSAFRSEMTYIEVHKTCKTR